ncbi:glycoside hydrolase [Thelonectria olida]|uniref:alpha-1,2-Mannosidase n=1 Tax=Thelonectria olida TaxID=1576542 RepID=A0A9P8VZY3_9HYPO|nr:glycoside hydrolase [Thelonectria olida]
MLPRSRSFIWAGAFMTFMVMYMYSSGHPVVVIDEYRPAPVELSAWRPSADDSYLWRTIATDYPPSTVLTLPTGTPQSFPRVQKAFGEEAAGARAKREQRRDAVKETFLKCWTSYRENAWMADELSPVSGGMRNPFGGWAATLVDALDTLWIMDEKTEFGRAVDAVEDIDFTMTEMQEINTFETAIRYLGAFLSAFDLSADARLLRKAAQVGEMLYKAFDTPNRMPIARWDIHAAIHQDKQEAATSVLLAEIGSMSLEFTRLSQLTGNPKWFDAVQRIADLMAEQQDSTELPGLWPLTVNAKDGVFDSGSTFTLGAMADSAYEYLPKMAALLGGQLPVYQSMYEKAMNTSMRHNLFRPMVPDNDDILLSGAVQTSGRQPNATVRLESQGQHLVCYLGGVMALGGKLFDHPEHLEVANKLTDGCVYAYKAFPHGIMPETFHMLPCEQQGCKWDENRWKQAVLDRTKESDADAIIAEKHLPKGFIDIPDRRYILRPEAIESVFVLYRVTGREDLLEAAWDMFRAINSNTKTELANTAVWDVTVAGEKPREVDSMESFWMGETLKYFYLVFSEPELISLDKYVFNTEAHPFRRET